ncbi:MAG TPA: PrsW family glutamic-type intramembrane protease [Ktedonobacteraceae bacterium]|nr:PrsW family glutamic-type intramembrane protease [Ktedonobacteraceae bacterium]
MSSEYIGPLPDPEETQKFQPLPRKTQLTERNAASKDDSGEATQPLRVASPQDENYAEPAYREHVSGSLVWHPADAPHFYPAYPPYAMPPVQPSPAPPAQPAQNQQVYRQNHPAYQGAYPGYAPIPTNGYIPYGQGYYGYPPYVYPYPWQPPKPRRDRYLFGMSIASFVGAILVLLGGLGSAFVLLIITLIPTTSTLPASQRFGGIVEFTAFALAGTIGGIFSLYHSIRSLFLKKPSADFKLPWFWLFLVFYLLLIGVEVVLRSYGQSVANIPLTTTLIALAGILPALAILALGVRRIHFPRKAPWPTSWRRFTLALVSGATLAIVLASIFELILTALAVRELGVNGFSIDNPDQPIPNDPKVIALMFILVSVIAPFVEEAVKPLAVVVMIGRIRSAAEAFVLGLAAGIGFDLIETVGYISMGYRDWLNVALERSAAGLLHGFGAAMVTLGWYYLTHPKESKHPFLLGLGCWIYAVLQHAIWNGAFGLQLLPAPVGPYLDTGTITIDSISMPSFVLVYVVESLLMLLFFLYVTGRLRKKQA